MKLASLTLLLLLAGLAWGQPPGFVTTAVARLAHVEQMQQKLGITREYLNNPSIDRIKVAVLDYGFEGVDGKRPYLPASTVVIEHYDRAFIVQNQLGDPDFSKPFEPGNTHGRSMAQIIWGITGHRPEGPQFFLLNANGPTLFRRAVRYAMEQRVDIILFSGVFEGAGNGDGRGFLNAAVREAIASGIIWINAAGNYGRRTYEGPVQTTATGELRFPGRPDPNVLRFRNRLDENTVTCTLTWNDYRETEDAGTLKDLDLYIENEKGLIVGSSTLKQITGRQAQAGETRNPRERVQLQDLPAGEYRIKIRTSTPKLWNSLDRFRLLIVASRDEAADPKTGEPIDAVPFLDNNGKGEIYPPADNPLVLTVGDITLASSSGATADHRRKPDILLEDARATFTNGLSSTGASNAAAYLAGMTVLLKAAEPRLSTSDMLALAHPIITKTSTTVRRSLASSPVVPPNALKSSSRLPPLQPTITLNTPGSANRPPFKDPWKMPARQQLHERVNTNYTRSTSLPP